MIELGNTMLLFVGSESYSGKRIWRRKAWGFESLRAHETPLSRLVVTVFACPSYADSRRLFWKCTQVIEGGGLEIR